jgi:hypothetical protein
MGNRIDITLTIDEQALEDLLITAGEHGSGYWARTEHPLIEALEVRDGIEVFDAENPKVLLGTLTRAKLLAAPQAMLDECTRDPGHTDGVRAALGAFLSGDTLDGPQADLVVQAALFGKIIYG